MPQRVLVPVEPTPETPNHRCRLEISARLERRTHSAGIAWRVTAGGGSQPVQARTLRAIPTLMAAELAAVRDGLRAAAKLGCGDLLVHVPDPRLVALLRGQPSPGLRRVEASAERLKALLRPFPSARFEARFAADPTVVHAAGEALDVGLHAAALREEHRVYVMERIMARAREVRLRRTDSGWLANDRYRVQLDPMRCECPAWAARWAKAPLGARRAQRLPCKHLVALAMREGISVPSDLAQLARKARE